VLDRDRGDRLPARVHTLDREGVVLGELDWHRIKSLTGVVGLRSRALLHVEDVVRVRGGAWRPLQLNSLRILLSYSRRRHTCRDLLHVRIAVAGLW